MCLCIPLILLSEKSINTITDIFKIIICLFIYLFYIETQSPSVARMVQNGETGSPSIANLVQALEILPA